MDIYKQLKQTFGFEKFRAGQEQTIIQLLNGHSSLAIFPTGAGKSLCYQLPAISLPHLTIVVSPLLALMKDQLAFLSEKGIAAASIDSTLSYQQSQQVIANVRSGHIKILMVSVERFKNERFRQFIESVNISMLVVDEAHCISEWGHNFRPDYLKLPQYRQALNIPLVLLLTATATKKVKQDMANKFAISPEHIVQTGFYRPNLELSVLPIVEPDKQSKLATLISQQQGSGIVYVTLQKTAEEVALFLKKQGHQAQAYHAGLKDEDRQTIQNNFMQGRIRIVVATIAFGMGIDKADIRFVIHYDLPKSIENYSQEIGRAGRDNQASNCITLANLDNIHTVENFIYADTPELTSIEYVINSIKAEMEHQQWQVQLYSLSNASNIRQLPLKTLLVQLELMGVLQAQYSYFADFKFKLLTDQENIIQAFNGERAEFLQQLFQSAKMKKVWAEPNFDFMQQHYKAPRKRIISALEYLAEKQQLILESKKATDVYQVNPQALNNLQLAEQLYHYFLEKEQAEISRIEQLVNLFQQESCLTANLCHYFDDNQSIVECGHCSVCRGQVAVLPKMLAQTEITTAAIGEAMSQLNSYLQGKSFDKPLSVDFYCRFLSGMTSPVFTQTKVRTLTAFGLCEKMRYGEIKQQVQNILKSF